MRGISVVGAALCAWLALSAPALAQRWVAVETTGFTVYAGGSERRAYEVANNLEEFDALLRRMTGAPAERSPTRLEVYLFSPDQFEDAFPYLGDNIAGVYMARTERIAAYSIFTPTSGLSSQETLYHEYAHHFMYQYFNNAYPAWYIEGFAEVVSTVVLGTERIVIGRSSAGRARFLETETWMPMEQLITTSTSQIRNSRDMHLFYAQSWLFAHYLLLTPGAEAQFRAYVRALRLGQPAREAFQTGFGVTPEDMQSMLRRYLRDDPNAIALTNPTHADPPETQLIALPASAQRLMPISARLASGSVSDENKAEVLAQARQLAGAAPYDDFALFTLARAEIRLGSPAAARALLEPYLAANENSRDALYLMGLAYLREADEVEGEARTALLTEARRYLGRGYRLDGNHVPTLARYAETYAGEYMSGATYENYVNVLLLARQLAPQVDEISLNAASVLVSANRQREAIPILRALAYDPHAGRNAEVAQRLLATAEGRAPEADANSEAEN
jgi:tetratricopeptide (TPR) repeat protein